MTETVTKRKQVTFDDGLPLGTRGTFTHDGELWIAYPASKNQRIVAVIDRMLGILSRISGDALRSINGHPGNTELAAFAARVLQAGHHGNDLAGEKVKAVTS